MLCHAVLCCAVDCMLNAFQDEDESSDSDKSVGSHEDEEHVHHLDFDFQSNVDDVWHCIVPYCPVHIGHVGQGFAFLAGSAAICCC